MGSLTTYKKMITFEPQKSSKGVIWNIGYLDKKEVCDIGYYLTFRKYAIRMNPLHPLFCDSCTFNGYDRGMHWYDTLDEAKKSCNSIIRSHLKKS